MSVQPAGKLAGLRAVERDERVLGAVEDGDAEAGALDGEVEFTRLSGCVEHSQCPRLAGLLQTDLLDACHPSLR